ncbi:MAG TPA: carboxylating nicotinate-nucleotide diphosphorylase [Vicinamibacteria bacterium]|nr:carboxylating nicotinate-nucleotide diphosphorylase [Vicinamibacteria bacterium]
MSLDLERVRRLVRTALDEDVGAGDVTSEATVPESARAKGVLLAKQELVLAGLEVARAVFEALEPGLRFQAEGKEGDRFFPDTVIATVAGRARALLTAERVALNFLQRLSGVATLTRRFADAVEGTAARIRDTRKTTPLLRFLEKHAVEVGGGVPHRGGLDAGILVKDNHVRLAGSVRQATLRAVAGARGLPVEIEVDALEEIEDAIEAGAGMVLLDNFTPAEVREAVNLVHGRVPLEASGGMKLENVRAFAEAGVDYIAVGALTHSAPAADISLEIEPA